MPIRKKQKGPRPQLSQPKQTRAIIRLCQPTTQESKNELHRFRKDTTQCNLLNNPTDGKSIKGRRNILYPNTSNAISPLQRIRSEAPRPLRRRPGTFTTASFKNTIITQRQILCSRHPLLSRMTRAYTADTHHPKFWVEFSPRFGNLEKEGHNQLFKTPSTPTSPRRKTRMYQELLSVFMSPHIVEK